jgi:hypothetical protein
MSMFPIGPSINYLPDPKDPTVFWPQSDPHYSPVQNFYNDTMRYRQIDQAAAQLAERTWKQWSVGLVRLYELGRTADVSSYRPAPVAPAAHRVTWNGSIGVVTQDGPLVYAPPADWNPHDWATSQTGTGEDLVKIDWSRQSSGGRIAAAAPAPAPVSNDTAALQAMVQQLLAALAAKASA